MLSQLQNPLVHKKQTTKYTKHTKNQREIEDFILVYLVYLVVLQLHSNPTFHIRPSF